MLGVARDEAGFPFLSCAERDGIDLNVLWVGDQCEGVWIVCGRPVNRLLLECSQDPADQLLIEFELLTGQDFNIFLTYANAQNGCYLSRQRAHEHLAWDGVWLEEGGNHHIGIDDCI